MHLFIPKKNMERKAKEMKESGGERLEETKEIYRLNYE